MAVANRNCHVCGKRYYYCSSSNCRRSLGKPNWMVMFCCESCMKIWDSLTKHFYKELTDEETLEILSECDLSNIDDKQFSANVRENINKLLNEQSDVNSEIIKNSEQ